MDEKVLPRKGVVKVGELLADITLRIPEYQRPYKWQERHVSLLLSDIAAHKEKPAYRLGTVVFHRDGGYRNIVDGQQRTISLILVVLGLMALRVDAEEASTLAPGLQNQLGALKRSIESMNIAFDSDISKSNIHKNYLAISRILTRSDFTEEVIDFFLNKCEVVFVELDDISEAFQFFDSQNARGRDLEPHDLLKAFHLREFSETDDRLRAQAVGHWESCETQALADLFSVYLFRVRNWSRGASARYFGKEHVGIFKGVNINEVARYPYVEQLRMAHHFVDEYNQSTHRTFDESRMSFPFQLDQIILNGRRFFEMIEHYQIMIADIQNANSGSFNGQARLDFPVSDDGFACRILKAINEYDGKSRTGDKYVRAMFDCLLVAYIDKFGMNEISRAVEKVFVWAYHLRLKMQVLQLASMDNYVLENNMFMILKEATQPAEFLGREMPVLARGEVKGTNIDPIKTLFEEMRYCE